MSRLLLERFNSLSDTPNAVAELRAFILDLAIRGKLAHQKPGDKPAKELFASIQQQKMARGKKTGIPLAQGPFPIPPSWIWVEMGDILLKLTDGTHHSPPNDPEGPYKYVTAKNIKSEGIVTDAITYVSAEIHKEIYSRCDPVKGDILYIKDGATTGVATINNLDEQFSLLSSVALLKVPSEVYNRLLLHFVRSSFFYSQMRSFMKGAAITRVTLKRMKPALLPLPPLLEQRRIVNKIDELMTVCDELEAAQRQRELLRASLLHATLIEALDDRVTL